MKIALGETRNWPFLAFFWFVAPIAASDFSYEPPGKLLDNTGIGSAKNCTVYAPGILFPLEVLPAFANSQVYKPGGNPPNDGSDEVIPCGVPGQVLDQCCPSNYSFPWQDNFCEIRTSLEIGSNPFCTDGSGQRDESTYHHQGQDIRPSKCENNTQWVVASAGGTVIKVPNPDDRDPLKRTHTLTIRGNDRRLYRYMHMRSISVGLYETVVAGQHLGRVSNIQGSSFTTYHLHFEIQMQSEHGQVNVPPYMSLVQSYRDRIGIIRDGGRVKATADTEVRASAGSSSGVGVLGVQRADSMGLVIGASSIGPFLNSCAVWWEILWDGGLKGWSVDNHLVSISTNPGVPSGLMQLHADGVTQIPVGGEIGEHNPMFQAYVYASGGSVKLQIELRRHAEYGGTFTGTPTHESNLASSGSLVQIRNVAGLVYDTYHWRARAVDINGAKSPWVAFGANDTSEIDFRVSTLSCTPTATSEGDHSSISEGSCQTSPPDVVTNSASQIGSSSAVLNSTIKPNGSSTNAFFQYGTSPAFPESTNPQVVASDAVSHLYSTTVSGLSCGTLYYFRAVATNGAGRTNGNFLTFRTISCVEPPACYPLTFLRSPAAGGSGPVASPSNSPGCPAGHYLAGTQLQVSASPANGWRIIGWIGTQNDASTSTINTVSMPANSYSIVVMYDPVAQPCYTLTPLRSPSGGGSLPVASPSNSPGCPTGQYYAGTQIQLSASPANGWRIIGWIGTQNDASASTVNTVSMPSNDYSIVVMYDPVAQPCYTLTLLRNTVEGGGVPVASPAMSPVCPQGSYYAGTQIQLTASPASGWTIRNWSGTEDNTRTSTSNTLVMPSHAHEASVHYIVPSSCFSLRLDWSPLEGGAAPLASPANSIGCPPGKYRYFEQIHLTAQPAPGWLVKSWSGTIVEDTTSLTNTVSMQPYDYWMTLYYRAPCERYMVEPGGGETFVKGEPLNIRWSWGGCGQTVHVQLLKKDVLYDTIAILPSTTESYIWTPSFNYPDGSDYKIKVVEATNPNMIALTFPITLASPPTCYLSVTNPRGGEVWTKGSPQGITWVSGPACTTVSLKLLSSGAPEAALASDLPANAGTYSWTPSTTLATASDYRIKITENSDTTKTTTSDLFSLDKAPIATDFYGIPPCRLVDTRHGPRLVSKSPLLLNVAGRGSCGIPSSAKAVSLNVTVVAPENFGHVALYPADKAMPATSTVNFGPGQNRANNAIVPLGDEGTIAAIAMIVGDGGTDLIVDVTGYFDVSEPSVGFTDNFEERDLAEYRIAIFGNRRETVSWDFAQDGASTVLEGQGGESGGGGDSIVYLVGRDVPSTTSIAVRMKVHEVHNPGHHSGVIARFNPETLQYYELWVNTVSNMLILARRNGAEEVRLATQSLSSGLGTDWITLRLEAEGATLRGLVNGQQMLEVTDETLTSGSAGLYNAGSITRFDDLVIEGVRVP